MSKQFMSLSQFNALAGAYANRLEEHGVEPESANSWLIGEMNTMYELPVNEAPTLHELGADTYLTRMAGFMKTLQDEMDEGKLIVVAMQFLAEMEAGTRNSLSASEVLGAVVAVGVTGKAADKFVAQIMAYVNRNDMEIEENLEKFVLVSLADWLADMCVFNHSEATKYGIALDSVFKIVMASNFTKLGEDGEVLKDNNGKFLKGPNYIAPEQHIEALLFHSTELLQDYFAQREALSDFGAVAVPLLSAEVTPVIDSEYSEVDEGVEVDESEEA